MKLIISLQGWARSRADDAELDRTLAMLNKTYASCRGTRHKRIGARLVATRLEQLADRYPARALHLREQAQQWADLATQLAIAAVEEETRDAG